MIIEENELVKYRYIAEDMTQVIIQATPIKIIREVDPIFEKHKKKYFELTEYFEEMEVNLD